MIPCTCPCCEVSCPPHRDGCTAHVDCPDSASDFDDVSLMRAEILTLRAQNKKLCDWLRRYDLLTTALDVLR